MFNIHRKFDEFMLYIARTDNIGDVVVSLYSAAWFHLKYPKIPIGLIAKNVLYPLVQRCDFISKFLSVEDLSKDITGNKDFTSDHIVFFFCTANEARLAKRAGFQKRTGTAHRWWHWLFSNDRVFFSRNRSEEHEAVLNLYLLRDLYPQLFPCSIQDFSKIDLWKAKPIEYQPPWRIIVHPFSNLSAPQWPLPYWTKLIKHLSELDNYEITLTGLESHKVFVEKMLVDVKRNKVKNLCGKLSLNQLMEEIENSHAIIATSTGPLHIGAAFQRVAIGLFAPIRPMHPGRWAHIGPQALVLLGNNKCRNCPNKNLCKCMEELKPDVVIDSLRNKISELKGD